MKLAYTAFDKSGKAVAATIEASAIADATEQLRRKGLFVTQIAEAAADAVASGSRGMLSRRKIGGGQKLRNLAMFSRQLFVLISSGVTLVEALTAIERQTREPRWRTVVTGVREKVETGSTLASALAEHPDHFNAVFRSLINAGESSGKMPHILERLSSLCRKQLHLRSSILGAMIYPAVLLSIALCVLVVMLIFVLPRFADLFKTLGAPLPWTTQLLMSLSHFLISYWWAMPFLIGGVVWAIRAWFLSERGTKTMQTLSIRVPKFGSIFRGFATAQVARLLGILLDSHVPLIDAIKLTHESAWNHHYKAMLDKAEEAVTRGEPISNAFMDEKLISASVYEAVKNGERSGQMGPLLLNIADFLDEENEVVIKSLTSLIEPLILIVLGLVVGFVAISMFLPLFDLTAAVGGEG